MEVTLMEGIGVVIGAILFTIWNMWWTTRRNRQTLQKVDQKVEQRAVETKREANVQTVQTLQEWLADEGRKRFEAMEKRNQEMEQRNRELEKTINGFVDRLDVVENERDDFKKRLSDTETALEAEKLAAVKRKEEYAANYQKQQEQIDLITSEYGDVKLQRDHAMKEVERLTQRVSDLEKQVHQQQIEIEAGKAREQTLMLVLERFQVVRIEEKPQPPPADPPTELDKSA